MVVLQVYIGRQRRVVDGGRSVRPATFRRPDAAARDRPCGAAAPVSSSVAPRRLLAVLTTVCVYWNVALMAEFATGLMDRQHLEPARNAYDAFVTMPTDGPRPGVSLPFRPHVLLPDEKPRVSLLPTLMGNARRDEATDADVRILYLADIRFPLERANGIQTMETCHALASRRHDVTLVVRPDTQPPPRDPFAFYELAPSPSLHIERVAGRRAAARHGAPPTSPGRSAARWRTRQAGFDFHARPRLASLLLRLPRRLRAPVVYEAHGIAADTAAALPTLLSGAPPASRAKLRSSGAPRPPRLATRRRLRHDHERARRRAHTALRAPPSPRHRPGRHTYRDGERPAAQMTNPIHRCRGRSPSATLDTSTRGRESTSSSPCRQRCPDVHGLIVGGHEAEPDLARLKALAVERVQPIASSSPVCSRLVTRGAVLPTPTSWSCRIRRRRFRIASRRR